MLLSLISYINNVFFDNKICLKKYRNKSHKYFRLTNSQVVEPMDMYGKYNKNQPKRHTH